MEQQKSIINSNIFEYFPRQITFTPLLKIYETYFASNKFIHEYKSPR